MTNQRVGRRGEFPRICIRGSDIEGAGLGLFVEEDVPSGGLVAVYGGALTRDCEAEGDRLLCIDSRPPPRHLCVDASVRQCVPDMAFGDYANSARPQDDKRANARYHYDGSAKRNPLHLTYVKATRKLRAGEEVLVDYGRDYDFDWRGGGQSPPQPPQ